MKIMSKLTPEEVIKKQSENLKEAYRKEFQFVEDINDAIKKIEIFQSEVQSSAGEIVGKSNKKLLKDLQEKYNK